MNSPTTDFAVGEFGIVEQQQPIPEPTTILLMGCGLVGLLGVVIRQRRKEK